MESKEIILPIAPAHILRQAHVDRFTNIFFNMAVTMSCLILVALLSRVFGQILYFFVLASLFVAIICMIIFTLGIAFAIPGNPVAKLWGFLQKMLSANDSILHVTQVCFNATKWLALAAIITSVVGIAILTLSKKPSKVGRIVLLSILIVLNVAVFAFQIVTGGMQ